MKSFFFIILSVLLLTSCGGSNKESIDIPHVDILVKNFVDDINTYRDGEIVLDSIVGIKEYNDHESFIVTKITDIQSSKMNTRYMILIITKSNKGEVVVSGQTTVDSLKDVEHQINYVKKHNNGWDQSIDNNI